MRRLAALTIAATMAASLSLSGEALAGPITFDFDFSGSGVTASGTLDATLNAGSTDQYTVTGGSGTISGISDDGSLTFVGLPAGFTTGTFGSPSNIFDDQIFIGTKEPLDDFGILFTSVNGLDVNFYNSSGFNGLGASAVFVDDPSSGQSTDLGGHFTLSPAPSVPEPSTLLLAALAAPAIAAAALRRRRARAAR